MLKYCNLIPPVITNFIQLKIPDELLFTHVVRCYMEDFQQKTYDAIIEKYIEDSLDRKSQAASNFCFPILNDDKTEIIGTYGKKGLSNLLLQIKTNKELLNKNVNTLLGSKYDNDLINCVSKIDDTYNDPFLFDNNTGINSSNILNIGLTDTCSSSIIL